MLKNIVRFCLLFAVATSLAQTAVNVNVDLNQKVGTYTPIYSWFGYDESNYSTTKNGQALLRQLHDLSPVPVYIRAHFLLAYRRRQARCSSGARPTSTPRMRTANPVYSWTILDQIFDAYAAAHVRPMVELGFMPEALSTHPEPYHIGWPLKKGEVEGWSFPPKDYERWEELTRQVAAHMAERYGAETVSTWYWEVWNEPNGEYYWKGTQDEYNKLYDYAVAGVRKAIPDARVGGPATTGPGPRGNASAYLEAFLAHCAKNKSDADRRPDSAGLHLLPRERQSQRDQRPRADGPGPRIEQCLRRLRHR